LPAITGLTEVERLLVIVTVCAALVVATVCAAKVRDVGAKVSGNAAVPFTSNICWATVAVSVKTTAPLMLPFAPKAGENVTLNVQLWLALSNRPAMHLVVPLPAAVNSPLDAIELRVIVLALTFFTVTVFAVLVVPTASVLKVRLAGVNVSGAVLPPEPVPENVATCGLNDVLSVMVAAPLIAPAAVGLNVTAILHLAFAASDAPHVVPLELMA